MHSGYIQKMIWPQFKENFVIKFFVSWVPLSAHAGEIHTVLNNLWGAAWVTSEHDTGVFNSLGSFISWRLLPVDKDSLNENCIHTYDSKSRCVFSFASFSWQNQVLGQEQWANLLGTRPCKKIIIWDWPQNLQQIPSSWEWSLWWRKTFSTTILLALLFTFETILRTSWHDQCSTNVAVTRLLNPSWNRSATKVYEVNTS